MIKLTIRKPGLLIKLPGTPEFRTPVEIDLKGKDLVIVIAELRRQSITEYTIKSYEPITPKRSQQKNKPKIEKEKTESNVDNRLNVIENLLKKLVDKPPDVIEKITREIIKESPTSDGPDIPKNKFDDDEEDIFIPSVSTDHLKSDSLTTEERTIDDVSDAAEALHKLNKK